MGIVARSKTVTARILPLIYFLAVSLPHHPFSSWLDDAFIKPVGYYSVQHIADGASWILLAVVAAVCVRIAMLVEQAKDRTVFAFVNGKLSFIMSFERHDEFWIKSYFGKVFHVLGVGEGLLAIALLCVGTWAAVRWLRR
jgi:hypothetical protein